MRPSLKRNIIRNLASPYALAMFSFCVFLFAWVFPPDVYTDFIHEPNLMFLNLPTLGFYASCVAAFMLGLRSVRFFGYPKPPEKLPRITARMPLLYLSTPLFISTVLCGVFLIKLGGHIDFVAMLSSGQGEMIKRAMGGDTEGNWSSALYLLSAVLWWAYFRANQLELQGFTKVVFYLSFTGALGVDIVTCVATVDRTNLLPVIAGLFLIYIFFKTRAEKVNIARLALISGGGGVSVIGAFLALSFLRGASAGKLMIASLMGYTVVSYNRLAALVTGVMHYAYEGRAEYLLPLLVRNDRLNTIIPMRDWFGWPDLLVQMESEFNAVLAAGLNPNYNWAGYFGYIYSDLAWWTPVYAFLLGAFAGIFWLRFCEGKTDGIVMYMWNAFSILFWVGGNWIFSEKIVRTAVSAVLLVIYDRFSLRFLADRPAAETIPAATLRERAI
jgi:hypothetical protein